MSTGKYYNPINDREVTFDSLAFTVKGKEQSRSGYRIYQDATHFVFIKAESVAKAILDSGVENPVKVIHAGVSPVNIFQKDDLEELENQHPKSANKKSTTLPPPKKPVPLEEILNQ